MIIVKIVESPRLTKRYRVIMSDDSFFDFGVDKEHNTYIDHHDKQRRESYRARHLGNRSEYNLINNLVPSPSLMSFNILWGESTNLHTNINSLNKLLIQKYGR